VNRPYLGIVTGLAREARCFEKVGAEERLKVVCVAAEAGRAAAAAGELAASKDCGGLISFGVAGGLAPGAQPGTLVVPDRVVTLQGESYATDSRWRRRLLDGLNRVSLPLQPSLPLQESIIGIDLPAHSVERKQQLRHQTGGYAVDTESHAVARAAVAADVPFLVVRAIADPWHREVPAWLPGTIAKDGRPDLGAVLIGLLQRPWQLPRLAILGLDFERALRTLRRVALCAGPFLRFAR
jgi:adenosylhomocysteine nucleosidase